MSAAKEQVATDFRRKFEEETRHMQQQNADILHELDPEHAMAYWNLSGLLKRKHDIPGAIEAMEEYIRRGNPDNDGEQRLAYLRRKLEAST